MKHVRMTTTKRKLIDDSTLNYDLYTLPCMKCQHRNKFFVTEFTCKAFPKGIPDEILMQEVGHKKKHSKQKNSIVYQEIIFGEPKR